MKKRSKRHRRLLRFPLYLFILAFLFLPGKSPLHPLLDDGKDLINVIFTRQDIQAVFYALERHYKQESCYPAPEMFDDWLWETFRGNFSLQIPLDRWGEPLVYAITPERDGFSLTSSGKDKTVGTKDDFGIEIFYSNPRPKNL